MKFAGICTKSVGHPLKGRGRDWEHCIRGPQVGLQASLLLILLDFQLGNKKLPLQFGARTLCSPLRWLTHKILCWNKCSLFFSAHSTIPFNLAWVWERNHWAIPLDPQKKFAGICTKSVSYPLKERGQDWEHCIRGPQVGLHASLLFILLDFQLGNKKLPFQFGARTLFSPLRWLTYKILCWNKCSLFFSSHFTIPSNLAWAWERNKRAIPLDPQMKFAGICTKSLGHP